MSLGLTISRLVSNVPDRWRAEDGWLVFDEAAPSAERCFAGLLRENAALPGQARYCLTASGALRLRADVPWDDSAEEYAEGLSPAQPVTTTDASVVAGVDSDIAAVCRASGWPFAARANGDLVVDLDCRPVSTSAVVSREGGELEVATDLLSYADGEQPAAVTLEAIGRFLLSVAGAVRMVRPGAVSSGGRTTIRLAVRVPVSDAASWLPHAFSALSVAACISRAECKALLDADMAALYLRIVPG